VRKICVCKICAISLITFAAALANAQLPSGGNGFFGYSYVRGEAFANSRTVQATGGSANMNGWEASAEGKYLPWLGVVGDLDWHYGGHNTTTCAINGPCTTFRLNASRDTLLFGPRASITYRKFRPFAEVLLGIGYQSDKGGGISNSDLSFASAFGGGVDYQLARMVALRAQLHSVHTSFFGESQFDLRVSTGVVFHF
jgi:Outer membrane protein beta-barrel domain